MGLCRVGPFSKIDFALLERKKVGKEVNFSKGLNLARGRPVTTAPFV